MKKIIKNQLQELGFNTNEIRVYLALTELGEAKAAAIAKQADLPRTTVISILDKLKNDNYLTAHKYRGTTYYWVESPKTIKESLLYKVDIATDLENSLNDLYRSESHFPFGQVYDTKSSIKKFIEKIISGLNKKDTIYTIDSPLEGNYVKIFSEDFNKIFLKEKKKKEVLTHTLVPHGSFAKIDPYKINNQNIIIRELPADIKFSSSLWFIKGNMVHFSGKPPFVSLVKHEIIVSSMKSIYDFLWNSSEIKN
jgi:sugar-specific transcriptional regulator TrmB